MWGLGDPDAFPVRDLGVVNAAAKWGLPAMAPVCSLPALKGGGRGVRM